MEIVCSWWKIYNLEYSVHTHTQKCMHVYQHPSLIPVIAKKATDICKRFSNIIIFVLDTWVLYQ